MEYVNDMNGSPGPIPVWGFCAVFSVPLVYGAFKFGFAYLSLVAVAQIFISIFGGWWLIRLGHSGLVKPWKGDLARKMFLLPLLAFFIEFVLALGLFVWWKHF